MKTIIIITIAAIILFLTTIFSPDIAYPREGMAKRSAKPKNPPAYWVRTALQIGKCEQPKSYPDGKPRYGYAAIDWHQSRNYSYKGGLGMTNLLWDMFKRKGQPEDMNQANPAEQIRASWRFYNWAEQKYPGAGYTGWECSNIIGFHGFNDDGSWK
jgi:hypothetical protein